MTRRARRNREAEYPPPGIGGAIVIALLLDAVIVGWVMALVGVW